MQYLSYFFFLLSHHITFHLKSEFTSETQDVAPMICNLESTGKPDLDLTSPKSPNQNADLTFNKSDTFTPATSLQLGPFATSNNLSAIRKSSESTFRTGKFLFVLDLNSETTIIFISFLPIRALTVITSAQVNSHRSIKLTIHSRTPATSQHYEHPSKPQICQIN